jgi:uncharacterized RDD family membrane protein YckC
MTQPPDDRPRPPDQPEGQSSPEDPTVPWTPPDEGKPADEGGVGWAAIPDESDAPADTPPGEPTAPLEPTPPVPPPAAPAGPIISASPTAPAAPGAGSPELPAAAPPGGGWQLPAAAAAAPQQEGYVIAGVGARLVAWLMDILLAGLIPGALSLYLVDWNTLINDALERARLDPTGQISSFTYEIPITLDYVLITLIGLGIQYLYFVGFWTSSLRATPGMIGLKLRVVDAGTGGTLTLLQATKRWIALGWPLGLLVLIPALQNTASLIQLALVLVLFFSVVLDDRKQGLQDKFANSLVIRSVTSGDGATVVGCLVWCALVILVGIIVSSLFLTAAMPQLQEFIRDLPPQTA